jgi:hypothetical protein
MADVHPPARDLAQSVAMGGELHRICGQLCGEPASTAGKAAPAQGPAWFAQIFSTSFSLKINTLGDSYRRMTGFCSVGAWIDAAVEYPSRANPGFPDG